MFSYLLSAKTGDNLNLCFYNIAADLAGVVVTKPDLEISSTVIKAELIDYQKDDVEYSSTEEKKNERKKSECIIS